MVAEVKMLYIQAVVATDSELWPEVSTRYEARLTVIRFRFK